MDRPARLRGADRRLAEALEQLRNGVPLNWSQLEDDPELPVLARMHEVAQECIGGVSGEAPSDLRASLLQELAKRLPEPKPEPVKAAPKSLAGFSERVQVLTQAEEDVPSLISRVPQWVAATVALSFVAVFALSALSAYLASEEKPDFTWIEVRSKEQTLTERKLPAGWKGEECRSSPSERQSKRTFVAVPANQIQDYMGFAVDYLPYQLSPSDAATTTLTLRLDEAEVAPCLEPVPDPADAGGIAKLTYSVSRPVNGGTQFSDLTVFESEGWPVNIEVPTKGLKSVKVGETRGIYWRGALYTDISGELWMGETSVLALERGDRVAVLVGYVEPIASEGMVMRLAGLLNTMWAARELEESRPAPSFAWIEMRRRGQVLSQPKPPDGWTPNNCITPSPNSDDSRFKTVGKDLGVAQKSVSYPILSLPVTATFPITRVLSHDPNLLPATVTLTETASFTRTGQVTYRFAINEIGIRACRDGPPTLADPAAKVKVYYQANRQPGSSTLLIPQANVEAFQMRGEIYSIDVGSAAWEEVRAGDAHGIYWQVPPEGDFTDPEGVQWAGGGGMSVMVVEKPNNMVIVMLSVQASKELLAEMARQFTPEPAKRMTLVPNSGPANK